MARVVIENLTKTFPGRKGTVVRAVSQASLVVEDREFLVLVGPSGCGKSTTLRMIAGLEEANGGTITIDGKLMNGVEPKDRDLAMVFQSPALYPHKTARENMAFGLMLRKVPKPEIDRRVNEAAEMLGLKDCLARRPQELSGGERQRVALGRAIVRQPKVFLFDEPLSNLDAPMRAQMRREIAKLHEHLGATAIYVTHDQVEALTMGDRIAVMNAGTIQQVGEPMQVYDRPANLFVAGFIGAPAMNFFPGTLARRDGGLFFEGQAAPGKEGAQGFSLRVEDEITSKLTAHIGKKIICGIRAENLEVRSTVNADGVEVLVEIVEPRGAETYLYATTGGGNPVVARIQAGLRRRAGERIWLVLDMERAHFFETESGRRIG